MSTSLKELLRILFAPYILDGHKRIEVEGCDLPIGPTTASSLALILHERATNAAKYGALSESGSVKLLLSVNETHFDDAWIETGDRASWGFHKLRGSVRV